MSILLLADKYILIMNKSKLNLTWEEKKKIFEMSLRTFFLINKI